MIITEISVQKRNKNRCNVYIDGAFSCAFNAITVVQNGLKVGMEITEEELNTIAFQSETESALNYAFDYVSKFAKTEKGLRDKLKERGYLPAIADHVVNKVKEYGYISDVAFAEQYVESGKKKKGGRLLKYELKAKGVSEEILESIELSEEDEYEAALAIAKRFFEKNEPDRDSINKLYAKLSRKGFSFEVIKRAINSSQSEEELDYE